MGERFGTQLRAERTARGLSQTQLGGEEHSPSYICLLEIGRREPTPEIIAELAARLELAPLPFSWLPDPAGSGVLAGRVPA
ncbi:helix-turn-helix domain-containing protein [Sinomonas terrae]|uniref:helix-turn-helix domain-containing protein n=1 Tax=Sinomonas terrae TaxID=2908838 RepID=UPI003558087E